MKQYKIFKHPSGNTEAVKQGWSWPAFFFTCIWAIVEKQWILSFGLLAALIVFVLALSSTNSEAAVFLTYLFGVSINIVLGFNGNALKEGSLISRGYIYASAIGAANPEGAVALYLKSETIN